MAAQVCDFGTAHTLEVITVAAKVSGTYRWMAPEVAEDKAINKKCDVFSFSLMVWELMEHKIPFHDIRNKLKASIAIMDDKRPPISSAWPDYLSALTKQGHKIRKTAPHLLISLPASTIICTLNADVLPF